VSVAQVAGTAKAQLREKEGIIRPCKRERRAYDFLSAGGQGDDMRVPSHLSRAGTTDFQYAGVTRRVSEEMWGNAYSAMDA
jgi:hypothetical protein